MIKRDRTEEFKGFCEDLKKDENISQIAKV